MAKDQAGAIETDKIVIENNNETPPDGYTQEEWSDLSATEREGILESIKEPEGEEAEELGDDEKNNLEAIAGEGKTQEEIDAEATAAEQTRLDAKAKELNKTVDEVVAIEDEEKKNQGGEEGDEVTDEALLNFHPALTAEELPEFKELEEEIPEAIQTELNALSEKFDLGDITQREYDAERDKLNRQIIKHNITLNETAKTEHKAKEDTLLWEKEQLFFISNKPEYQLPKPEDPPAEKMKRNAVFGALKEMVATLSKDPQNANLSGMQLLVKADKAVKEALGIKPAEKKPAEKKGSKPAAALPDHKTLGDVPNAGANNDGVDDTFAQIDKLTGEAYEQALERMKPEVREAYLARV